MCGLLPAACWDPNNYLPDFKDLRSAAAAAPFIDLNQSGLVLIIHL